MEGRGQGGKVKSPRLVMKICKKNKEKRERRLVGKA